MWQKYSALKYKITLPTFLIEAMLGAVYERQRLNREHLCICGQFSCGHGQINM